MRQKLKEPALQAAESYVSEEKGVVSGQEALDGAKDILAELVSDEAKYRTKIRKLTAQKGKIVSSAKDEKQESVYEMYYEFEEMVAKIAGHRILALNRGRRKRCSRSMWRRRRKRFSVIWTVRLSVVIIRIRNRY